MRALILYENLSRACFQTGVVQRQFTLQAAAAESTVAEPLFSGQTYFIRAADLLDEQWSLTSTVPPAAVSFE